MAPGLYAVFGFLSLTVAILGFAGLPQAFFWLSLQSLLVVSMALWIRSRFLVVANSLIFASLMLVYLVLPQSASLVSFSFAGVALLSARIMNWQKERLTLRTEMLRNAYLFFSFVFVIYALFEVVPKPFVALAWAGAAAGYFVLSVLLSNVKYRWLGLGTLLAAIVYALFVNLAGQSPGLRIVAFLGLGALAVVVSLFYSRLRRFLTHV